MVANASVWALLASTPVHVFVNMALVETGGVTVKGTTIVGITTEPVDLDNGPAPVGPGCAICAAAHAATRSRQHGGPCI